jgi:predicted acetyltransferase
VQVRSAVASEQGALGELLREYLVELGADPLYRYLPLYWSEPDRFPYFILRSGTCIGFALVRGLGEPLKNELAEFYIVPAARGCGAGRAAAEEIFRLHPGVWELSTLPGRIASDSFWTSVLKGMTGYTRLPDAPSGRTKFCFCFP